MPAWYPGLTQQQKMALERLNKAAVRMIIGANRHSHSAGIYKRLKLLKTDDIFTLAVISSTRKLQESINNNNKYPTTLHHLPRN